MSEYKNLGTMNGWKSYPPEYNRHFEECGEVVEKQLTSGTYKYKKYDMTTKTIGNCWTSHTCHECKCSWDVDSSG